MKPDLRAVHLTGLPWYEPESYERVCALMHDKDPCLAPTTHGLRRPSAPNNSFAAKE